MESQILYLADVLALTGVSRNTIFNVLIPKMGFPKPFKVGLQKNGWLRVDVEAWAKAQTQIQMVAA